MLWAHLHDPPPAPPDLEQVMAKALAKGPEQRYAMCGELVAAAGAALGLTTSSRPAAAHAGRDRRRVALAASLSAFFLSRGDGGPAVPSTTPTLAPKVDSCSASIPRQTSSPPPCGLIPAPTRRRRHRRLGGRLDRGRGQSGRITLEDRSEDEPGHRDSCLRSQGGIPPTSYVTTDGGTTWVADDRPGTT